MPVNKYGMLLLSGMVAKGKIITAMGTCPMTIAPIASVLSVLPLTRAFQLAWRSAALITVTTTRLLKRPFSIKRDILRIEIRIYHL
jgi:hypothetical protein